MRGHQQLTMNSCGIALHLATTGTVKEELPPLATCWDARPLLGASVVAICLADDAISSPVEDAPATRDKSSAGALEISIKESRVAAATSAATRAPDSATLDGWHS